MENQIHPDFSAIIIIIAIVLLYMVIGSLISQLIYSRKIEERLFAKNRYSEAGAGLEQGVYLVGWIVVLPYDLISKFKRFKNINNLI